ncbi:metallophosphoesterase [Lewinella cohaerens]|uniref:metallophosphoesterase n=1 Tax=Lewinella cohaerens TaxID=70995 RepID=UPI000372B8A0|nr:metallophosphoesterase [Lewinella cohaerens]
MRIIQITDLHVGTPEERPFDIDIRANFIKVLKAAKAVPHDLLVISGDLCLEEGDLAIYQWIKQQLDDFQFNYLVIPGNHDDKEMMVSTFGLHQQLQKGALFLTSPDDQPPLVLLDSGPGQVDETTLSLLQEYLQAHPAPICLFMHHPPMKMGVPFMDNKHALRNREPLLSVLTEHSYPISIFTGHYHVEKSMRWRNLDIHITPSCYFQIDWKKEDFAVDHHNIAYRYINWDGETLEHTVFYV